MTSRASLLAATAAVAAAIAGATPAGAVPVPKGCVPSDATAPAALRGLAAPAPGYAATASFGPRRPVIGSIVTIQVAVKDKGAAAADTIVQINIYGEAGKKVFHRDLRDQAFAAGQTRAYTCTWRPQASGIFTVKVGTFSADFRRNYYWNNKASVIRVN